MKNYYEILEVDKNASQEVIEKAYKVLAKKYHPDLQQGEKQREYAEKLKIINEAYDVLSNNLKRQQYNEKLQADQIQNQEMSEMNMTRGLEQHKIKYKHDLKYYLKAIMLLCIIIFICFFIYQIPFVKNFFTGLYKENVIFQAIVDIFKNTFSVEF